MSRALDVLVAERVMRWTDIELGHSFVHGEFDGSYGTNSDGQPETLPFYSTDIAAAWQVVQAVIDMCVGYYRSDENVYVNVYFELGRWWMEVSCYGNSSVRHEMNAAAVEDTAPMAICVCALRLFDIDEDEIQQALGKQGD